MDGGIQHIIAQCDNPVAESNAPRSTLAVT
jgi:hypothetical protein